jgi:hypothetical protein
MNNWMNGLVYNRMIEWMKTSGGGHPSILASHQSINPAIH